MGSFLKKCADALVVFVVVGGGGGGFRCYTKNTYLV